MDLLVTIVLVVGVFAVVASWAAAVVMLNSDRFAARPVRNTTATAAVDPAAAPQARELSGAAAR